MYLNGAIKRCGDIGQGFIPIFVQSMFQYAVFYTILAMT